MRQGQNNNRRGRNNNRRHNNNNNKPQNMLTKTFDSNGPDIKIRGNAATIAEKYLSLAHDALSAGSRIKAENYFQHAEHYKRIVSVAQEQQAEQRAAHEAKQAAIRAQKAEQAKLEAEKAEANNKDTEQTQSDKPIDAENITEIAPSMVTQTNEPVELIQQNDQDAENSDLNAKEEKPKRKPSMRPKRKPAPKKAAADEADASENTPEVSSDATSAKEEKPKRAPRKPRAKKPAAKKEAEAEVAATNDAEE